MAKAKTVKARSRSASAASRSAIRLSPPPARPQVGSILKAFKGTAVDIATARLNTFASAERDRFVDRIREQDFSSFQRTPLSWRTIGKRRRAGNFSTKTLFVTGRYTDSIKVYENKRKDGTRILIGIHQQTKVRDLFTGATTSLPMTEVADYNENGSSALRIPSRPHWWPYFVEMRVQRVPGVVAGIKRAISAAWNNGPRGVP